MTVYHLLRDAKRVCLVYMAFDIQKTHGNLVCLKFLSLCEIGLMLVSGFCIYQGRTDRHTDSCGQCNCISLIFSRIKAVEKKSTVIEKAYQCLC